jgi:hypothetical protein
VNSFDPEIQSSHPRRETRLIGFKNATRSYSAPRLVLEFAREP